MKETLSSALCRLHECYFLSGFTLHGPETLTCMKERVRLSLLAMKQIMWYHSCFHPFLARNSMELSFLALRAEIFMGHTYPMWLVLKEISSSLNTCVDS
jgi:hypothetical protein